MRIFIGQAVFGTNIVVAGPIVISPPNLVVARMPSIVVSHDVPFCNQAIVVPYMHTYFAFALVTPNVLATIAINR